MTTAEPDDLLPLREAAPLVDRSPATLRAWIRAGELHVYRGEGTHPANAPALVSRAELLHLAGLTKATNPPRPPRREEEVPPSPAGPTAAELDALRALAASREETAAAVRSTVAALDARIADLSAALERERARADAAEAELQAIRVSSGLPWWRRLLPG